MDNVLNFEISKFDLQEISNSELMKVKLWIVSEGDNRHKKPIPWSAIENAKSTLVGKPIVAKYDKFRRDLRGHEKDEIAIGAILSEDDIFYETDEDGKRWLCAYGIIWMRYALDVAIVMNRDKIKNLSMEISCVKEGENNSIEEFVFRGITLIGVTPAIPNARAELLSFSAIIEEVKKIYYSDNQSKNNLKNNFDKYFKTTLEFENKNIDIIDKGIKKEDEKMDFEKTPEMFEKLKEFCSGMKYSKDDKEFSKYSLMDYCKSYMYAYDMEEKKFAAIPYEYAEESVKADMEGKKSAKVNMSYSVAEDDETDDFAVMMSLFTVDSNVEPGAAVARAEEETEGDKEKIKELETEKENMSAKIEEMEAKFSVLETENNELKTFKDNIIQQEKEQKIEFAAKDVIEKGMPKETVEDWKLKIGDFENVDSWANAIKAFAFDNGFVKSEVKDEGFNRMGLPHSNDNKSKSPNVWDRLKQK